jgi:hypothetical protein
MKSDQRYVRFYCFSFNYQLIQKFRLCEAKDFLNNKIFNFDFNQLL